MVHVRTELDGGRVQIGGHCRVRCALASENKYNGLWVGIHMSHLKLFLEIESSGLDGALGYGSLERIMPTSSSRCIGQVCERYLSVGRQVSGQMSQIIQQSGHRVPRDDYRVYRA